MMLTLPPRAVSESPSPPARGFRRCAHSPAATLVYPTPSSIKRLFETPVPGGGAAAGGNGGAENGALDGSPTRHRPGAIAGCTPRAVTASPPCAANCAQSRLSATSPLDGRKVIMQEYVRNTRRCADIRVVWRLPTPEPTPTGRERTTIMLSHTYSYEECLHNSLKVAWKEEDAADTWWIQMTKSHFRMPGTAGIQRQSRHRSLSRKRRNAKPGVRWCNRSRLFRCAGSAGPAAVSSLIE